MAGVKVSPACGGGAGRTRPAERPRGGTTRRGRAVIDLSQAATVHQIFSWVGVECLSLGEVTRRLNAEGIPTATGKTHWDRSVGWGMLQNPAYPGRAAFGKTQAQPHPPRVRPVSPPPRRDAQEGHHCGAHPARGLDRDRCLAAGWSRFAS